jgi:hypothetical protein
MENKNYPKVETKTRGHRSSSLTQLVEESRASRTIPPSDDLAQAAAGANNTTELNVKVDSWKQEERIPPRPSQAEATKSGFEMAAAREIIERKVESITDLDVKEADSMPKQEAGDDVDGDWSVPLI